MTDGIRAAGLRKSYGGAVALDRLDLAVPAGSVCALLGHNGAGKTTAMRIFGTLLRPDGGEAIVAGYDAAREPHRVRAHVGIVGQHAAVDEVLSGRENLELFGRLFHLGAAGARRRADELLEQYGLAEAAERPVAGYSGGMRRRLDLAASLVLAPPVLLLDEPTTGLDPRARSEIWAAVRALVAESTAVLLTTQYLDEADRLADRVTMLAAGRVVAEGTPAELKARLGADRIELALDGDDDLSIARRVLAALGPAAPEVNADACRVSAPVRDRVDALTEVVHQLAAAGVAARDITLRSPTLDEAFLALTDPEGAPCTG